MVSSPRAGKGTQQQLPTRTFVLLGFAAGIMISCVIIWGSNPPAENAGAEDAAPGFGPAAALRANKLWSWALSKARRPFVPGSDFSRDGDFVAAYYTEPRRHKLVEAGREWRKEYGIRTVVVSNIEAEAAGVTVGDQYEWDEVWQSWPDIDDQNRTLDINTIAYFKGDHRGAMTPLIAHRELGDSYKWMLYGDDDSVFFPEGVARAVQGLDPDMPYFICDRSWGFGFGDGREYGATPRCVPCNWNAPPGANESAVPVPPLRGCPCDRLEVCTHWNEHFPGVFPDKCEQEQLGMPVPHHMTFHGGGGTILSIGLLRQLNFTEWQECVESMKWRQGSDSYVTKCIWKAGYGMTDPGYSYLAEKPLEHFTFDRWTFRGENVLTMVPALERKITDFNEDAGFCQTGADADGCIVPDEVDELFVTMVSVHGQGGRFKNDTDKAASAISLTTKVYRDYMDTIAKAHPEAIALEVAIGAGTAD